MFYSKGKEASQQINPIFTFLLCGLYNFMMVVNLALNKISFQRQSV